MDGISIKPDKVLDCSGLTCPKPVIETAKAIKEIAIGEVLKVISTDPGSPPDMEAWSEQTGHAIIQFTQEENDYIFYFLRVK
jgi:tRNA 2-thiouridine synthesizing protein A